MPAEAKNLLFGDFFGVGVLNALASNSLFKVPGVIPWKVIIYSFDY